MGLYGVMAYRVGEQGEELGIQIEALEKQQAQEATHRSLQRTAETSKDDRQHLESFFLSKESDSIDFLNQVESLAPRVDVALRTQGLEVLTDVTDGGQWIVASFGFSGTREQVQQFIQILETMPYVSRLTEVQIGRQSSVLWQATVTMQVRILTYDE